jgi:hypothetical protein
MRLPTRISPLGSASGQKNGPGDERRALQLFGRNRPLMGQSARVLTWRLCHNSWIGQAFSTISYDYFAPGRPCRKRAAALKNLAIIYAYQ